MQVTVHLQGYKGARWMGCDIRVQKLWERRGSRRGLPVPNSLYGLCGRKATMNFVPQSSGAV